MRAIDTEVLVIGSGAGGATTAVRLAEAGRSVTIVEEGPEVHPDAVEPFSLEEMVAKYRHGGGAGALGQPPIAYTEGRCVGGSTEVNSGLWHRLPSELTEQWRSRYDIDEFDPATLDREAAAIEDELGVSSLPGPPPRSSAVLDEGATKLGWRSTEFPRVFRYDERGRGVKQTMARTFLPRALAAGAVLLPDCRITKLERAGDRVTGARARLTRADGTVEDVVLRADVVFVCGGAIHSPALLQRSGVRRSIGRGLKLHPTIKIAARFPFATDHDDVAMHRITEFAPAFTIGGSASRRGHVAMALAETAVPFEDALADWRNVGVYYAAIRSEGSGAVVAIPGLASPLVTYRLTPNDLSKLAQGLVALGEALLAAGAVELYPSVTGATVARSRADLASWWDAVTPKAANLMTVHLTSSIRMGERGHLAGTDSFGRVHGYANLHVNDASLLPDAPGVNPQAGIMAIASRNAAHFLTR
ncbi:GMC family oxidoreductase [Aquihabitans sp. G128]|uniref:GMC family oxidoreductase n=1 Tax=Aquihabitans sp. G128 TaxID=2849779 RepID=UPI001C21DDBE|nr:GMC family oxidoreductase [Aquihabitans sp. G128]QXC62102.1 GMC family oxidoreductase [Aquihabitans sp. G128]